MKPFNKRGMLWKVLFGVILAAILLIPACTLSQKLLRLSWQAQENFAAFSGEIQDLADYGKNGEHRTFTLIMDQDTFIAAFSQGLGEKVPLEVITMTESEVIDQALVQTEIQQKNVFVYPALFCKSSSTCICLCKKYTKEKTTTSPAVFSHTEIDPAGGGFTHYYTESRETELDCSQLQCQDSPSVPLASGWGTLRQSGDARRIAVQLFKGNDGKITLEGYHG